MVWLTIIIILAILALIFFLNIAHIRRKATIIIVILLFLFIYITFAAAYHNKEVNFKSASGIYEAGRIYFSWLGQAFGNVKTLASNAIKMDWVPEGQNVSDLNPQNFMRG